MVSIGLMPHGCLPFVSKVLHLGLLQLVLFAGMGLWQYWYCFVGILLPILLLVGQFLFLLGWAPFVSFIVQLSSLCY